MKPKLLFIFLVLNCWSMQGQYKDTIIQKEFAYIKNEKLISEIERFIRQSENCCKHDSSVYVLVDYFTVSTLDKSFIDIRLVSLNETLELLTNEFLLGCIRQVNIFINQEFVEATGWAKVLDSTVSVSFKLKEPVSENESDEGPFLVGEFARPWAAGNRYELKDGEIILVQKSKCELKKNLKAIEEIKKQVEMEEKE